MLPDFIKTIILATVVVAFVSINCVSIGVPVTLGKKEKNFIKENEFLFRDLDVSVFLGERICHSECKTCLRPEYDIYELIDEFTEDLRDIHLFKNVTENDTLSDIIIELMTCEYKNISSGNVLFLGCLGLATAGIIPVLFLKVKPSYRFVVSMRNNGDFNPVYIRTPHNFSRKIWLFSPLLNLSPQWSLFFMKKRYLKQLKYKIMKNIIDTNPVLKQ